jgi:hypothetical protein
MPRKAKCSSGDWSRDYCKYLKGIPEGERIGRDVVIERKRAVGKEGHTEVKIIAGGVVTYHKKEGVQLI